MLFLNTGLRICSTELTPDITYEVMLAPPDKWDWTDGEVPFDMVKLARESCRILSKTPKDKLPPLDEIDVDIGPNDVDNDNWKDNTFNLFTLDQLHMHAHGESRYPGNLYFLTRLRYTDTFVRRQRRW
jgi:hypothetical protein